MKQPSTRLFLVAGSCLASLAISPSRALAQTSTPAGAVQQLWVKNSLLNYQGQTYTSLKVATDAASNVYELYSVRSGKYDGSTVVLTKYAPDGQQLWRQSQSLGPYSGSVPVDMAVDAQGNVYVSSYAQFITFWGSFNYDWVTTKYSARGDQVWLTRYDSSGPNEATGDIPSALAIDAAGNVFVTGSAGSTSVAVKYNPNGQQVWATPFAGTATDVAADGAGGAVVAGTLSADFLTLRFGATGQLLWQARYDSPTSGADAARAVAVDAQGNVVVTGSSATDYATVQYSPTGQPQWAARYNGPGNGTDAPQALVLDATGGVYVTGASAGAGTGLDYATLRYSSSGQQLWVARYAGPYNDQANDLALDAAGNVYVTGSNGNYVTIKYDPAGQEQWLVTYANTDNIYNASGPAGAKSIAVDAQANVVVTGNANTIYNLTNVATVKYVQAAAGCNPLATEPRVPAQQLATAVGAPLTFTTASLLSGATDPLGRTLQVASIAKPSAGTLVKNTDGSYTYTPQAGYTGNVTLSYVVQEVGSVLASPATKHYYEFVSAPGICWAQAKAAAAARTYQGLQGYLATITYQGEQDFVSGRQNGQYWLGASDEATEGEWRWTTGPEAGTVIWRGTASGYGAAYTNWLPGQPDDYKNQYRPQGEDYALFYGQSGYWNDVDACATGTSVAGYLVEYGGLESCTPVLYTLGTLTIQVGNTSQAAMARMASSSSALATATASLSPALEAMPNPSNGQFRVRVTATQDGPAQLELFDVQGRRVRALYSGNLAAGETRELAVDDASLATGLYQLRLQSAEGTRTLRLSVQQ